MRPLRAGVEAKLMLRRYACVRAVLAWVLPCFRPKCGYWRDDVQCSNHAKTMDVRVSWNRGSRGMTLLVALCGPHYYEAEVKRHQDGWRIEE